MDIDFNSITSIKPPLGETGEITRLYLGKQLVWEPIEEVFEVDYISVWNSVIGFSDYDQTISKKGKIIDIAGERFDISDYQQTIYNNTLNIFLSGKGSEFIDFLKHHGITSSGYPPAGKKIIIIAASNS